MVLQEVPTLACFHHYHTVTSGQHLTVARVCPARPLLNNHVHSFLTWQFHQFHLIWLGLVVSANRPNSPAQSGHVYNQEQEAATSHLSGSFEGLAGALISSPRVYRSQQGENRRVEEGLVNLSTFCAAETLLHYHFQMGSRAFLFQWSPLSRVKAECPCV